MYFFYAILSRVILKDPESAEAFKEDPVSQAFLKSGAEKLTTTMKPSDVDIR